MAESEPVSRECAILQVKSFQPKIKHIFFLKKIDMRINFKTIVFSFIRLK